MIAVERIIAVLSPKWAASRSVNRLRSEVAGQRLAALSAFSAADKTRTNKDWGTKQYSADQAIIPDGPTIRARARAAKRDHWAARSIVDAYRRHVVGTGITCRAKARDVRTGESLSRFNNQANTLFDAWANNPRRCDIEGRKTFIEMQGLLIEEWATVGESFVILHYDVEHGLRFQVLEPEQLANRFDLRAQGDNQVRDGVEVNQYGRSIAYWFNNTWHPYDGFAIDPERVPAERVLHFFTQERAWQTRGVSRLAPVLVKLRHMQMYDEYQIVRARLEACIGAAITRDPGMGDSAIPGLLGGSGDTEKDGNLNRQLNFEPGMVWELMQGEKLEFMQATAPGNFYEPFTKAQLRQIAAGAGMDYPTVARDFTGGSFSSQREGHLERDKETDRLQRQLIDTVIRPIRDEFIRFEIASGRLVAPDFFNGEYEESAYLAANWAPPPKPWIDPSKQAAAAKIALDYRLTTRQKELNILGEDVLDTFGQLADEKAIADGFGITLPDSAIDPKVIPQEPKPTSGFVEPEPKLEPVQ